MPQDRVRKINSTPVLVLSTGYEPMFQTNWRKAMVAVCGGRAEIVETHDELWIGTVSGQLPFPTKVRYLSGILVGRIRCIRRYPRPSKKNLWYRDRGCCQYCGINISLERCTIDHVIPKSRGGRHEWSNIVLACARCNQKKGSRLICETGMQLIEHPVIPNCSDTIMNQLFISW